MRKDGGLFVCAGRGEDFSFAKSIGVGLVESSITLTQICQNQKPKFLVFIGSAGSYDKKIKLLDLFISNSATQIEISHLQNKSYTPLKNQINSIDSVSCETINKIDSLGLPRAIVNSSNYISTDFLYAQKMREKGILLENMEFFAVLSVAKRFQIPARGIFCVSNYCDTFAHQDFLKNQREVIEKLYFLLNSST